MCLGIDVIQRLKILIAAITKKKEPAVKGREQIAASQNVADDPS